MTPPFPGQIALHTKLQPTVTLTRRSSYSRINCEENQKNSLEDKWKLHGFSSSEFLREHIQKKANLKEGTCSLFLTLLLSLLLFNLAHTVQSDCRLFFSSPRVATVFNLTSNTQRSIKHRQTWRRSHDALTPQPPFNFYWLLGASGLPLNTLVCARQRREGDAVALSTLKYINDKPRQGGNCEKVAGEGKKGGGNHVLFTYVAFANGYWLARLLSVIFPAH